MKSSARIALVLSLLFVCTADATAQNVPPSAANDASVGAGTGVRSPITPTGGYAASVPISLPPPRGRFALPLSVQYSGNTQVGAAGAGWDIPLSFVRSSHTTWHRKPAVTSDATHPDFVPERITLSLGSQSFVMVPSTSAGVYFPFLADEYMELRRQRAGWILYTSSGVQYEFSSVSAVGDGGLADPDLWVLTAIRDTVDGDHLAVRYATASHGCGAELDLDGFAYTYATDGTTPLYDVQLNYSAPDPATYAGLSKCGGVSTGAGYLVGQTDLDDRMIPRTRTLSTIVVNARNNLSASASPHVLQQYSFTYNPDPDLGLPRLTAVNVDGENAPGPSLPVVQYTYGTMTTSGTTDVALSGASELPVPQAAFATVDGLEGSISSQLLLTTLTQGSETRSRFALRDFTGDGVADLIYAAGNTWHLIAGRVTDDGPTLEGGAETTWTASSGPPEIYVERSGRVGAEEAAEVTAIVTEFVDWNGDGRLDIVDATGGGDRAHWRVWLNEPGAPVHWQSFDIDVSSFATVAFPMSVFFDVTPLEQSRSWPHVKTITCEGNNYYPPGASSPVACPTATFISDERSETANQWQLADANGDSFIDVVMSDLPVRECESHAPGDTRMYPVLTAGGEARVYGSSTSDQWLSENGQCTGRYEYSPAPGEEYPEAVAFLNRAGTLVRIVEREELPSDLGVAPAGLSHWSAGVDDYTTSAYRDAAEDAGFLDAHARGLAKYTVGLYGSPSSAVPFGSYDSSQSQVCRAFTHGAYASAQSGGLADLNGDGIPDLVSRQGAPGAYRFHVRFGGTAGFGPDHAIAAGFDLSNSVGFCDGDQMSLKGLVDLDGDGRAEVVWFETVAGVPHLRYQRLLDSDGESLDAGRLISVGNGHGAATQIAYANNKAEGASSLPVPAPEIVVSQTQTVVDNGTAVDGAPVRYAYGTPEMRYDPVFARTSFAGYARTVTLVQPAGSTAGVATIADRSPQAVPGASFDDYAVAGRLLRTTRLEGDFDSDARALLTTSTSQIDGNSLDGRARAQRIVHAGVTELPVGDMTDGGLSTVDCLDVDVAHAIATSSFLCEHAGTVYDTTTESWEGGLVAANQVTELSETSEVDDRGRPTYVIAYGDAGTFADDTCTSIEYAAPTASSPPAMSVVSAVHTTDCGWTNGKGGLSGFEPGLPITLVGSRMVYDGLPEGQVGRGQVTSQIIENYDVSDGSLLDEHVAVDLSYNAQGEVAQAIQSRTGGSAATKTTTFTYDAFAATTTQLTTVASDVTAGTFTRTRLTPVWPSLSIATVGLNGERTLTKRDRFGRVTSVSTSDNGASYFEVLRRAYDDNRDDRNVTETTYPSTISLPQVSHVHLDALGRLRFRQTELGASYHGSTLVEGLVHFDELGRPVYEAEPFEWPTLPFSPDAFGPDLRTLPYGVSTIYDPAGRVVRTIEGPGYRDVGTTSVSGQTYVTSYSYAWSDGRAITRVSGPRDNDPTSAAFGSFDESQVTALGWSAAASRFGPDGTRIDLIGRSFDHLGHETAVRRFRDPVAAQGEVRWTNTYDSAGRVLTAQEPGASPVENDYDDWGELLETSWTDGTMVRIQRHAYDGLGRQTQLDLLDHDSVTGTDSYDSSEHAFFDRPSGSPNQPAGPLLGRLSYLDVAGVGDAYFSYDSFGRSASETYRFQGVSQVMRTARRYTAGGALQELSLSTQAGLDRIGYVLDSAARVKTVNDLTSGRAYFDAQNLDAKGRYRRVLLGNGVTESNDFATTGREDLIHQGFVTASGTRDRNLTSRDGDGRVLGETWSGGGTGNVTNEYDVMGRLGRSAQSGQDERFLYDALGNTIQKRNVNDVSQNRDYAYDTAFDPDRLCNATVPGTSGSGFTPRCDALYDGAGNVVGDTWNGSLRTRTFSYDPASRLATMKKGAWTAAFIYGPGGELAREDVYNGLNLDHRTWSFGDLIEQRTRADGHTQIDRRIPGPEGLIATLRNEGSTRETVYVHGDSRGNRFFTRADGKISQEVRYRAYGEVIANTGVATALTYSDDLFNGGDDLHEFGAVLIGARIYDPSLGRFLQRDPLRLTGASSLANPYAFSFDDPMNWSDPAGLSPCAAESSTCAGVGASLFGAVAGLDYAVHHLPQGDPAPQGSTAIVLPPMTLSTSRDWGGGALAVGEGVLDFGKVLVRGGIQADLCIWYAEKCVIDAVAGLYQTGRGVVQLAKRSDSVGSFAHNYLRAAGGGSDENAEIRGGTSSILELIPTFVGGDEALPEIEVPPEVPPDIAPEGRLATGAGGDTVVNRIGGGAPENLALKPAERRLKPPGISVLLDTDAAGAARQITDAFPGATRLLEQARTVGQSTVERIRNAGFDVIPDPTVRFPNHGRLIHPDGAAGFCEANLCRLSDAFEDVEP